MGTCVEASYGDHHYLKYKSEMEGIQSKSNVVESLPDVAIAIFGLGRIGTIHLDNLRRNHRANIMYCVEESSERVNYVRNKWKLFEPETTFLKPSEQDKVFKDKRIDAVLICTPTFTHEEICMKSLESGKAVFCEKPLALNDDGIERCLEAAKKYKRPLLCAFNRRFDPGLRSVKDRIESGEIGQVQVVKTCSRDSPKPSVDYLKISGGIFHDCAVHDIDYICWLLGEYPCSVSSFAHAHYDDVKELGDHDTVCINMKFPSGKLATIDLSRCAVYGYDQRVEVFGNNGMLTCGEQRPTGVRCHNGKGATSVPIFFSFASRYQEAYAIEMEHFLSVVQGLEECNVKGESILAVSKIASACEESVREGKVIPLKWDCQNGL
ncbi:myo-inositol 2-dehydrogenase [Trichonephila clavata]|uniref:Myo-inositol 2-dehydrogenase n=1 Tax=Trichonephila clavata TaxID=2740835 RepID=A0A8X6K5N1_TRICU|nr:myo-inositol 2-dehydrogenase [Trichonephila clavata]